MKEKNITIVSRDRPRPARFKSDLERLRKTTDAEIDAQIKNDPDWSDDWNWSDAVLVVRPKKKPTPSGSTRMCWIILRAKSLPAISAA